MKKVRVHFRDFLPLFYPTLDELEMKLEWTNVELRKKLSSWDHIEHIEMGTQTIFPKYKKELAKMKTITPTPKSPFQKYYLMWIVSRETFN